MKKRREENWVKFYEWWINSLMKRSLKNIRSFKKKKKFLVRLFLNKRRFVIISKCAARCWCFIIRTSSWLVQSSLLHPTVCTHFTRACSICRRKQLVQGQITSAGLRRTTPQRVCFAIAIFVPPNHTPPFFPPFHLSLIGSKRSNESLCYA